MTPAYEISYFSFNFDQKSTFKISLKLSSRTRFIPVKVIVNFRVNVQPHYNGHFCWRRELASPAAEVQYYQESSRTQILNVNRPSNHPRYTKTRPQVKQARLPTKTVVTLRLSYQCNDHVYVNGNGVRELNQIYTNVIRSLHIPKPYLTKLLTQQ